ncbi:thioesterase II family protein [Streptomyces yaizuensis]|uniref:Alpha/beta fold hydrolase n=1 Tax=Streptomyces yaizuensis TaxID=2989713 RepID=A0ABQ5NZ40_9ACTN|nr:alpha/beta fold hydrolase [Streptomyces sp. YSPA8]GLF95629.1 alpha/beta fold hydrolase [Streptomyces sp. YSPA8]
MTRYLRRGGSAADGGRLRMFCFPYAGGGASAYAGWQRRLGAAVDVQPVQLPGREGRMADPRFTDLRALVDDLDEQLGPALEGPHVLYGHSMGALIAFALAQRRHARGRQLPLALLLSAHRAPHLPPPAITNGRVSDDGELIRGLAELGGLPRALLDRPEWLAALLPVVRGDLLLCASSGNVERAPVPVPVHTFAGVDDRLVTVREIREWSAYTTRESENRVLPGGHFFIREQEAVFLEHLTGVLRRYEDVSGFQPLDLDLVGAPAD